MLKILLARLKQGYQTMKFPNGPAPALPDRFRGLPDIQSNARETNRQACAQTCPTGAIRVAEKTCIDLGKCLFCPDCVLSAAGEGSRYTSDYRLAVRHREDLLLEEGKRLQLASALEAKMLRLFGRSLKLRQVSAGGCNACEADVNVLNTVGWDIGRFGIQFVASPRHADGLLITGPVTHNMKLALEKTYQAVPSPRIVIAVGACAIAGGPYIGHQEVLGGAESVVPVDLFIPGCPPHPLTILDGLLRLLGRIEEQEFSGSPTIVRDDATRT